MQAAVFQRYNLIARSLTQAVHDCQSQAVLLYAFGEDDDDVAFAEIGTLLEAGVERVGARVEIMDAVHDRSFRFRGWEPGMMPVTRLRRSGDAVPGSARAGGR